MLRKFKVQRFGRQLRLTLKVVESVILRTLPVESLQRVQVVTKRPQMVQNEITRINVRTATPLMRLRQDSVKRGGASVRSAIQERRLPFKVEARRIRIAPVVMSLTNLLRKRAVLATAISNPKASMRVKSIRTAESATIVTQNGQSYGRSV
jgi:hypothetical protein